MCVKEANEDLVSVIIPFFNREAYLQRAVDSVVDQTYSNWEIVLVDDGSTDGSSAIAAEYASLFPTRIRLFQQENSGPGAARNKGIAEARGSLVAILDSDDQWTPVFLQRTTEAFDLCAQVDWVYVNVQRKAERGEVVIESVFDDGSSGPFRKLCTRKYGHLELIDDPDFLRTAIEHTIKEGANSVIKREVFDRITYNPDILAVEDRVLNIEAIAAGFRFGFIDEILLTKYHHGGNISLAGESALLKRVKVQYELIKAYKYMRKSIPLKQGAGPALKRRLGDLYYEHAALLFESRTSVIDPIVYVARSLAMKPVHNHLFGGIRNRLKKTLPLWRNP